MVLDSQTGKVLAEVQTGSGTDRAVFDSSTVSAISSNGESTLTVVKEVKPGKFEAVQILTTMRGYTHDHHQSIESLHFCDNCGLWASSGSHDGNPKLRPVVKPETFIVLEYAAR